MEENDKEKVPIRQTQDLEDFLRQNFSKEDFDKITIKEVREKIVFCLDGDNSFDWFKNHIEKYLNANDFPTVFILLRRLSVTSHWEINQKDVIKLISKTVEKAISDACGSSIAYYLKDALVILCGKINNSDFPRKYYNEDVRNIFKKIIDKFYPSVYGSSEDESRLISRVLFSIMYLKDTYFIPILQKKKATKKDMSHLMKYVSVSRERIALEGLRALTIQYLES